ncbi:hypothetical protein AMTRI_Chr11g157460 [Amborella trichopoda]|uniref:uncharacterized protein LOC105421744 n=1 Tax=Amborella trichopoda TaxID=13333 RepID=UPI0005D4376A|nr:uncharacterized protein LOC105421744 [Amborella trichopoda]|eukprot:XP_011628637.1 uncharacterized protein LOC105421744 [Amborella trichopoda]
MTHHPPKIVKSAVWKPPLQGWLKLNFDGSVRAVEVVANYSGILRNHLEDPIFIYSGGLQFCDINEIELCAVKEGVSRLQVCHSKVLVEGDLANIISWYKHPHKAPWLWTSVMDDIQLAISSKNVVFCHVNCEKNGAADVLARSAP